MRVIECSRSSGCRGIVSLRTFDYISFSDDRLKRRTATVRRVEPFERQCQLGCRAEDGSAIHSSVHQFSNVAHDHCISLFGESDSVAGSENLLFDAHDCLCVDKVFEISDVEWLGSDSACRGIEVKALVVLNILEGIGVLMICSHIHRNSPKHGTTSRLEQPDT